MSHKAVLMFESALQKALPNTDSAASSEFELLLKARKKAKAEAAAPAEAPAVNNAAPQQMGRGTGNKPTEFNDVYPHLVHGKKFKILSAPGAKELKTIGEHHPDYAKHDAPEFKADNPYEKISRMGYELQRKLGAMSPADQAEATRDYEHPNHPNHIAYAAKLIQQTMDQQASHNVAFRSKHAGGQSPQQAKEAIGSGLWRVTNKRATGAGQTEVEQPKHFHDLLSRIAAGGSDASKHTEHAVSQLARGAAITANFNRLLHSARGLGEKFHSMSAEEFQKHTVRNHDIADFSQARIAPGFHDDHLKNTKGHNPLAAGDFDAKGKATHKPIYFFSTKRKKGEQPQSKLHGFDNLRDVMTHMHSLEVSDGRAEKGSGKQLMHDYLTPAAKARLSAHAAMFGPKKAE